MNIPITLQDKITTAPLSPGCYIYKDAAGEVIYVGKAVSIRNRVKQYFQDYRMLDGKTQQLVISIADVDFVTTDTEAEALILEANLIKKYRPKYNVMMKDDKSYAFVEITLDDDFPRIRIVREKKNSRAEYFGPYPDTRPIRRILKKLRQTFHYRSCNRTMKEVTLEGEHFVESSDPKPCLYYHLGLCDAPCASFTTKFEYRRNINQIKKFLRGEKTDLINEMKTEMNQYALDKEFEKAAVFRDKINDLIYIGSNIKVEKDMDEGAWVKKKRDIGIESNEELINKLQFKELTMKEKFKIECYDISNIQGTNATSSMVVLVDGRPAKNFYRKFKIKTKSSPDDFEMMRETFRRRFGNVEKHKEDESFGVMPDLIVVDGGKGQLSATSAILNELGIDIPIIGLAKREEEVFKIVDENGALEFKKMKISRRSKGLYLLQKIRDEAHRFALKYHRILRSGHMIKSQLDEIPGIGNLTKRRLLEAFGSIDKIKKASADELQGIVKNKNVVSNIKKLL